MRQVRRWPIWLPFLAIFQFIQLSHNRRFPCGPCILRNDELKCEEYSKAKDEPIRCISLLRLSMSNIADPSSLQLDGPISFHSVTLRYWPVD